MLKKINKKNLAVMIVFLISLAIILHDLYIIVTILNTGWTLLGILTFCIAVIICELSYEYIENKIKDSESKSWRHAESYIVK